MDTQLENPVLKDIEGDSLRDWAEKADQEEGRTIEAPESATTPEPRAPEEIEGQQPDNSETEAGKPRDPKTGKFVKQEHGDVQAPPIEAAEASVADPESEYAIKQRERKEKETARLEKTWENVNARKDAIEQRERQIAEREQRLAQPQRPQVQLPRMEDGTPMTSHSLFTAANDFKARAKKAIAEGDTDTFGEQDALAEQAIQHGQRVWQIEQQLAQENAVQDHQSKWVTNMQQVMKETPELTKADSPLSIQVQELLKTNRVFEMLPDGFAKAKEIAQLRLDAASASELRETNTKLQAEITRLNGLTGVKGGGVTTPAQKKEYEDMSLDEMGPALRRMAENAGTIGM